MCWWIENNDNHNNNNIDDDIDDDKNDNDWSKFKLSFHKFILYVKMFQKITK